MDEETRNLFRDRAAVMKALAHPTRLFIVDQLGKRETCVCELATMTGADMSTVSKHLLILKSAGIVEDDKRGLQVFYRIKFPCVLKFFDCIEGVLVASAKERLKRYSK